MLRAAQAGKHRALISHVCLGNNELPLQLSIRAAPSVIRKGQCIRNIHEACEQHVSNTWATQSLTLRLVRGSAFESNPCDGSDTCHYCFHVICTDVSPPSFHTCLFHINNSLGFLNFFSGDKTGESTVRVVEGILSIPQTLFV